MDSIRPHSSLLPHTPPVKSDTDKKEVTAPPQDKVEINKEQPPEAGLIHKTFRGLAKVVGGTIGFTLGTARGGLKGAATEETILEKPADIKTLRAIGAGGGLMMGLVVGSSLGPLGMMVGAVVGPIMGATAGGAYGGAVDGLIAGTKGAYKGAKEGIHTGAQLGGKAVDWVANTFKGTPEK